MFGCIAAGRPVQTNLFALSPAQFTFLLPTSPTQPLNHLVVFLLPDAVLPLETAATVYIQLSPTRPFRFLGAISNDKPSAIFRVKGLDQQQQPQAEQLVVDVDEMTDEGQPQSLIAITSAQFNTAAAQQQQEGIPQDVNTVTLGISLESFTTTQALLSTLPPAQPVSSVFPSGAATPIPAAGPVSVRQAQNMTLTLARKIMRNAFNYLSGFAVRVPGAAGDGEMIPLRSFQDWWARFERKVEYDPGFLEREDA